MSSAMGARSIGVISPRATPASASAISSSALKVVISESVSAFNALLLIAEADAGVARGEMTPIDLAPVALDMAELYAPLAEEKGVALRIAPAGATMIDGN